MKTYLLPIIVGLFMLGTVVLPPNHVHGAGVKAQICMVVDGSSSIDSSEWSLIKQAVAKAVNETIPHDGSVELTIVQFGYSSANGYAKTEISPTVIDDANYATVASQIVAMPKGGGSTPTAHGLYLGWKEIRASPYYAASIKQVINLATDEAPNIRNNNATIDLDGSGGSPSARDDAIAVADNAASQGLDELDVEGIGLSNSTRDWFRDWVARPQPGILAPPFTKPGWIRIVANVTEFVGTISEKFGLIVNVVRVQLCMVVDGSGSISTSEWNLTRMGVANAIRNNMPHDGSVELSIVQFADSLPGGIHARVELQPTIITTANFETIATNVSTMTHGGGGTPMAHGLFLGWQVISSSSSFSTASKHIINLATDGATSVRNLNATSDLDESGGSPNAKDDVIAVINAAEDQGLDELDIEAINLGTSERTWFVNWTARPQPGILAPPFTKPGWVRAVTNFTEFADTVGEKFQLIFNDVTPPVISNVLQQPPADNVTPVDKVEVYANVTDDLSGVRQVILNYTVNGATTYSVKMSNLQGNQYNATIQPPYPAGTNVSYILIAEDFAGNSITTLDLGYTYQYRVVPEFSILAIALMALGALFIAISFRRKHA